MDEINSLILYGCKLVKDLELNLQNFFDQPNKLLNSCDEIAKVFTMVRDRLNASSNEPSVMAEIGGEAVPEWLRYGVTQAMDTLLQIPLSCGGELATDIADSSRGRSWQRPRRKDDVDRRTIRVPASRIGNTEIPAEDGHTWRKYGQKEILGSRFPRCTHQKIYNCPAKKQVQRLDEDPFTFQVTYCGDHTCHMSLTAPSIPTVNEMLPSQQPTPENPFARWLSMNLNPSGEGNETGAIKENRSPGDGGFPTVQFGSEADYHLNEAGLADTMFNTDTGGNNNSLDSIFSSNVGEKRES